MSETNADFIIGLRALADWYEANPNADLRPQTICVYPDDTKEEVRRWSRMLGTFTKNTSDTLYTLSKQFGPVQLDVVFLRDIVCERRVVGTKAVTEKVPDPGAPLVEITREEEIVEWDCPSALAPEVA